LALHPAPYELKSRIGSRTMTSSYSFNMFRNQDNDTDVSFTTFELQILNYALATRQKQFDDLLLKEMGSHAVKALRSVQSKLEIASGNGQPE